MHRIASIRNRPRISQKPQKTLSASSSTLEADQLTWDRRLPRTRLTVPTAMQVILRGSMALHRTWVRIPLGRMSRVSNCPVRTMEGKLPVIPLPKHSVR